MTEHTPGPWTALFHHPQKMGGREYVMITAGALVPIAAVVLGAEGCSQDEGRANARLVAALPELVKALEPFAKIADDYDRAHEQRVRHYADEGHKAGPPVADHHRVSIALGECRAARAALAKLTAAKPPEPSLTDPETMGFP